MLFEGGFSFTNFLVDVFAVFVFVVWFWLIIVVFMDLFRRHDISGWAKAIWVIALIVFPYLGVLVYLITQSRGMAERSIQQTQQTRDELRRAVGFSAADEIEKLERLKKGRINHRRRIRASAGQGCSITPARRRGGHAPKPNPRVVAPGDCGSANRARERASHDKRNAIGY
jgi:hypothetical protein